MSLLKKIFNRKEKVREAKASEQVSIIDAPLDISWKADATSFDNGEYTAEVVGKLPFKEKEGDGRFIFNHRDQDGLGGYPMVVNVKHSSGKVQKVQFDLRYYSDSEDYSEGYSLYSSIKDEKDNPVVDENGFKLEKSVGSGRDSWGRDLLGDVRKLLAATVSAERKEASEQNARFDDIVKFAAKALDDKIAVEDERVRAQVKERKEAALKQQVIGREAFSRF